MSIKLNCPQCSRPYVLKDDLAGKRFRCKDCQKLVSIPAAEGILVAEIVDEDEAPEEDWEAPRAEPVRKSGKKKKKKGNQAGTQAVKILVSVVLGVVGLVLVVALGGGAIYGVIQASKNIKLNADWVTFTLPGREVSVMTPTRLTSNFPGAEKLRSPGRVVYGSNQSNQTYLVAVLTLSAEAQQLSDDEFFAQLQSNIKANPDASNVRISQLAGTTSLTYDVKESGFGRQTMGTAQSLRVGDQLYVFSYIGQAPINRANRDRFFGSVQVLR